MYKHKKEQERKKKKKREKSELGRDRKNTTNCL